MAQVRFLDPKQFEKGEIMLNHFFAENLKNKGRQSFFGAVEEEMREKFQEELPVLDRQDNLVFPDEWKEAVVSNVTYRNLPSNQTYSKVKELKLGLGARYINPGFADITPLNDVLLDIYNRLVRVSPRRKGFYRRYHEVYTNDKRGFLTRDQIPTDFGFITNRIEYASTLETPDFPASNRAYQRVITTLKRRRAYFDEYDITMIFADPVKVAGGMRYRRAWAKKKKPIYSIPLIAVMPFNSLPSRYKGNIMYKKRRGLQDRNNALALIRKSAKDVLRKRLGR